MAGWLAGSASVEKYRSRPLHEIGINQLSCSSIKQAE